MSLNNPLLSGSNRLRQVSDGAPSVKAAPPHDDTDAVRRIQKALRILTRNPMPQSFVNGPNNEPDGKFGQETLNLVIAFQKQAFPTDPREWDGRVGKKTLGKMDALLPPGGGGGGGVIPVPPPLPPAPIPPLGLTIVNQPSGNVLMLAEIDDAAGKSDLNSERRQVKGVSLGARLRVWFAKLGVGAALLNEIEKLALGMTGFGPLEIRKFINGLIESGKLEREAFEDVTAAAITSFPDVDANKPLSARSVRLNQALLRNEMAVGGETALELFKFWTGESDVPAKLRNFNSLDNAINATPNFKAAANQFEERLRQNVQAQARLALIDFRDLVTGPGPKRGSNVDVPASEPGQQTRRMLPAIEPVIPNLSLVEDRVAKICIGSFQGVHISMTGFTADAKTRTFTAMLKYDLRDHFGVDDDDCEVTTKGIHGTPGQVAMWVLQHFAPQGHRPFIDHILVNRSVTGKF
ncbi:peptidoglycan-binding protein [Anatilimnocola sp. NA78]|uniref:peptidoglycan-binding domain-containing protein n=1 Tax=Anatilimnocola sp. NA78 TaxID=3415683 RepID=UPI003CE50E80